jgi:hypothetical protein
MLVVVRQLLSAWSLKMNLMAHTLRIAVNTYWMRRIVSCKVVSVMEGDSVDHRRCQ